jgi:hypothetical protein
MSSSHSVECWALTILMLLSSSCTAKAGKVPAIIVFGDSTVDAGNNNYIPTMARGNFPPYGRDFDGGVATGRFSNGRLVTDFMSEALGLASSVPAYLDGSYTIDQLATGVNFASGGTGMDAMTAKMAVSYSLISPYSLTLHRSGTLSKRLEKNFYLFLGGYFFLLLPRSTSFCSVFCADDSFLFHEFKIY